MWTCFFLSLYHLFHKAQLARVTSHWLSPSPTYHSAPCPCNSSVPSCRHGFLSSPRSPASLLTSDLKMSFASLLFLQCSRGMRQRRFLGFYLASIFPILKPRFLGLKRKSCSNSAVLIQALILSGGWALEGACCTNMVPHAWIPPFKSLVSPCLWNTK